MAKFLIPLYVSWSVCEILFGQNCLSNQCGPSLDFSYVIGFAQFTIQPTVYKNLSAEEKKFVWLQTMWAKLFKVKTVCTILPLINAVGALQFSIWALDNKIRNSIAILPIFTEYKRVC